MITDFIVNYMIDMYKKAYKLEDAVLKEKTITENKTKLKFERFDFKVQVEFNNSSVAKLIFQNTLPEDIKNNIDIDDFVSMFDEYVEEGFYGDISVLIEDVVKKIS